MTSIHTLRAAAAERIENRSAVRAVLDVPSIMTLFGVDPDTLFDLFGKHNETITDSENRRLKVWYVVLTIPVWIISHKGRGTTYEVSPTSTDQECVAMVKEILAALSQEP